MAEPQYGEPWRLLRTDLYPSGPSWETVRVDVNLQTGKQDPTLSPAAAAFGKRVELCVNLLAKVPNADPCFSPGPKADEIQLALAVLAGEFGAAAALADEISGKYARNATTFFDGVDVVAYYEDKIRALVEECVERTTRVTEQTRRPPPGELFIPPRTVDEGTRDSIMAVIRAKVLGPFGRGCTTAPGVHDGELSGDPNYVEG